MLRLSQETEWEDENEDEEAAARRLCREECVCYYGRRHMWNGLLLALLSVGLSLLRGIFESGIWRRGWRIEIPIRNTFVQRNGGICTWIGSRQCATVCPVFPLLSAHLVVGRWVGGWWSYVLCAHLLFSWWDAGKERKGKSIFEREYEGETRNEKCGKLRLY